MSKNKVRIWNRNQRRLAFAGLLLLAVVMVPVLIAACIAYPAAAGAGVCCACFPFVRIMRDPNPEGGGGGGTLTPEQFQSKVLAGVTELKKTIGDQGEKLKTLEEKEMSKVKEMINNITQEMEKFRSYMVAMRSIGVTRPKGKLSNEAAAQLGGLFVLTLNNRDSLKRVIPDESLRRTLINETRGLFGLKALEAKAALTTDDIPLPTQYYSEIVDLIAEYGVVRSVMTPWPLSGGTDKPPRGKTRFGLTSIAMAGQFGEKGVQIEFASLESHKLGGIIYTPRELREQSIVALGQYIARLGAIAAAQVEDEFGFLADGQAGTYDSIKGLFKVAADNNKIVAMAAANTKPSDVTKDNIRAIFGKVNSRVRATGSWYMNNTFESFLPELNTEANQYVFRYNQAGMPLLYGRPIKFVEVMQEFSDQAAAGKYIMGYGDLSYWWFATRGNGLRIDESEDFKFDYDLISTRMIEEIDLDYMATDAFAAIKTGAGA